IAIIIASLYGVSDEVHQYFVPTRHADPVDWMFDTIGALLGASIAVFVISARTVKRSRERDRLV
ncbi:MAG: VanZ family protein, partial [Coriobacteriia bacterium]|nr:VanZ family protein [Coriobacteriia bacterium]